MVKNFCILSLNPAIDAEWRVEEILWEEKNVVHAQRRWAGGKGANVARWLEFLGSRSELLIPLGGASGAELGDYLKQQGIRVRRVPLQAETRVNVVITDRVGRQMRFNQPGAQVSSGEWKQILSESAKAAERADALILSGSLPPGAPVTGYATITRDARSAAALVFLDCDGATLRAAVKACPFLVKPNQHELSGWAGRTLGNPADVRAAAREMSQQTGGWVLVSMGAEGAMLVSAEEDFCAQARIDDVKVVNTLGAGDATLAGAAHAVLSGMAPEEWLRYAVAAGTAATQAVAGQMVSRAKFKALLRRVVQGINRNPRTETTE